MEGKNGKTLYFEGAGWDNDRTAVGNCRIRTALTNDAGERFFLELASTSFDKDALRVLDLGAWVHPGEEVGYVERCRRITDDPETGYGRNERHPIEFKRWFPWDMGTICHLVNNELGCSFGAAEVAPALAGYSVHREGGVGTAHYNYGDEFEYDPATTAAAQRIYERELARQRDTGEKHPCVSAWRDPDDPGILHVRHHREGFEDFDADLREELGRGSGDEPFKARQEPPSLEADIVRADAASKAAAGSRTAAAKLRQ